MNFLKKKNFHQILRNEILFAIAPRTLKSCSAQRNGVYSVMSSLRFRGFLRDEGFKLLGTMMEMTKIIGKELQFTFKMTRVDEFCRSGKLYDYYLFFKLMASGSRQWPVVMVNNGEHVVVLKEHKTENRKLMLKIRDSKRDPKNQAEIWIEENDSPNNQMNLAKMANGEKMAFYFELS